MRLSTEKNHPDYRPDLIKHAKVLVDGEPVKYCIFADDQAGVARCFKKSDEGRFIRDADQPDRLRVFVVQGKVEIILPDEMKRASA